MPTHLTQEKRYLIKALLATNENISKIAANLKVSPSTISREIKKNKDLAEYCHLIAQQRAVKRRQQASGVCHKLTPKVKELINHFLVKFQWSPEQITGRLRLEYDIFVSHEIIYRYIRADKEAGGTLYENLRRGGKKLRKRCKKAAGKALIPNRVGIEQRPAIVALKNRIGDFELDTIVGAKHQGGIVSIVDRKSKFTRLYPVKSCTAVATSSAIIKSLLPLKGCVKTLTSDNGKEFSEHVAIAKELKASFFFANPYRAWERGLNENTNGLVRQYFPKGSSFVNITMEDVVRVENLLNNRPRKCLNFRTPAEVFFSHFPDPHNFALTC